MEPVRLGFSSWPLSRDPTTRLVRDFEAHFREHESDQRLVIAAIAYGDETYIPGMPWNVGDCALGIGVSTTNPQIQVPNYNLEWISSYPGLTQPCVDLLLAQYAAIVITVMSNAARHTHQTAMLHITTTYGSTTRTSWTLSNTV